MTAPTYDDLFNAILAMDAYNRGYSRGLEIEGENAQGEADENPVGEKIGNFSVKSDHGNTRAPCTDCYSTVRQMTGPVVKTR